MLVAGVAMGTVTLQVLPQLIVPELDVTVPTPLLLTVSVDFFGLNYIFSIR